VPDAATEDPRVHRDRADLAQVLPQHVQRAAADDLTVQLRHQELRDGLVERDHFLREEHPPGVGVHELLDGPDVGGACPPHEWCRHDPSD
jgi:hypothetical protein